MATEPITLRYFEARGRAQPLRNALLHARLPFHDQRVTLEQWTVLRSHGEHAGPYASLPSFTWGADTIAETLAIAGFLSRKLGDYDALSPAQIAQLEAISSNCYLEVLQRAGELIWADLMYPGTELGACCRRLLPRMVQKLTCVERLLDGAWLHGAKPGLADFFASEAYETLREVCGPTLDAALANRMPRLSALAQRVQALPEIHAVYDQRPTNFTARDDEQAALLQLRAAAQRML